MKLNAIDYAVGIIGAGCLTAAAGLGIAGYQSNQYHSLREQLPAEITEIQTEIARQNEGSEDYKMLETELAAYEQREDVQAIEEQIEQAEFFSGAGLVGILGGLGLVMIGKGIASCRIEKAFRE
jgi:hypothetical protein